MIKQCPNCGTCYTTQDVCPNCRVVSVSSIGSNTHSANSVLEAPILSYPQYVSKYPKTSKSEYQRYVYLLNCLHLRLISELKLQPEFELRPRIVVKSNGIHTGYTQAREIYTADFSYRYGEHLIIEDVKGGKIKGKKRQLKPYVKTPARNKHKSLIAIWYQLGFLDKRSLLLTVWYGKQWHYFDSNHNQIDFSLAQAISEAA